MRFEYKEAVVLAGVFLEDATETKVHDPALALARKVVALVHDRAGFARSLCGVVGAGVRHDKDVDQLCRIVLVADGTHEVGDNGLLIVRRDEKGVRVELLGLGIADLATNKADNIEHELVERKHAQKRHDNVVEQRNGREFR